MKLGTSCSRNTWYHFIENDHGIPNYHPGYAITKSILKHEQKKLSVFFINETGSKLKKKKLGTIPTENCHGIPYVKRNRHNRHKS